MSYPLRVPEPLNTHARERAESIGISFNAFVCVALDAYLRGGVTTGKLGRSRSAQAVKKSPPASKFRPESGPRPDWRHFEDPETWPYIDPEFAHRWDGVDEDDEAACVALEIEYWATRSRPSA